MKKYLFGAVAALTIAAPAAAFAGSGYVGGVYSRASADDSGVESDADGWGVEGAWASSGAGLGFQVDGAWANSDDDTGDDADAWGVTGHLNTRNDSYLFGGFLGYADAEDASIISGGVEGEKYFSGFTLAGALGYATNDDDDVDAWGANLEARFFLSDNFRFDVGAGLGNIDAGGGGDDDYVTYGVGAEWQLPNLPLSFVASYQTGELDETDAEVNVTSFGLRWNFGTGSLKERDRQGASLAGLSSLSTALGL